MIYAKGTTFWHGVRAIGDRITHALRARAPGQWSHPETASGRLCNVPLPNV